MRARYKPVERHPGSRRGQALSKLLAVEFSEQIIPGTFEKAVRWRVDLCRVGFPGPAAPALRHPPLIWKETLMLYNINHIL